MTGERQPKDGERREGNPALGKWIGLGVGAGIGSAALAAALLYASRGTKPKPPAKPDRGRSR